MKSTTCVLGSVVLAATLSALSAQASPIISGDDTGSTFSNLTCTSCVGTSLTSSAVTLGSTVGNNSVLSIINLPFSASGSQNALELAELQLAVGNKAGAGQVGVAFHYNLVLNITTPLDGEQQTFDLGLTGNGGNGAASDDVIIGLGPLSFADPLMLSGVTLSNFRFLPSGTSTFANDTWTGTGTGNIYDLFLVADVTETSVGSGGTQGGPPDSVPEPAGLAVLGAGLLGLGFLRRRLA